MNTVDQVFKDGNDLLLNYISACAVCAAGALVILVGRVAYKAFRAHSTPENVQNVFSWKDEKANLKVGILCIATIGAVGLSILGAGISLERAMLSKS